MTDLRDQLQASLGASYTIQRELGGGGMSRVFLASDSALGRDVVIKVLPSDHAPSVSADRFAREVRLTATLQHPNIVPVLTAGMVADLPYYTMPFVVGNSLRGRLDGTTPLPIREAMLILDGVARALAIAHEQGIVHRDLKPENILLSAGVPMITDFGIAKALSAARGGGDGTLTATGIAVGTPAYMAPEQAAGDSAMDARVDVYAWGLLAYEIFAGRAPFAGRTPQQVVVAHLTEQPAPLEECAPQIPAGLASLVMRCLSKNPQLRPATGGAVLSELEAISVGDGDGNTRRPSGRLRFMWIPIGASAVGLAAFWAVTHWPRSAQGAVSPSVAVTTFANETGDPSLRALAVMAADWITQGIAETGLVGVVDPRSQAGGHIDGAQSEDTDAKRLGATLLVGGRIYRSGDSIGASATITDAATRQVRQTFPTIWRPASDARGTLADLRQRVVGAIAALVDPGWSSVADATSQPPSLAAYQEFIAGRQAYLDEAPNTLLHLNRAVALDSDYIAPLILVVATLVDAGKCTALDSVVRIAEGRVKAIRPFESLDLRRMASICRQNNEAAYRLALEMQRLRPRSDIVAYRVADAAMRTNRAEAAIHALQPFDPAKNGLRGNTSYAGVMTQALHLEGRHSEELKVARAAIAQYPGRLEPVTFELAALGAEGNAKEIGALLDQDSAIPRIDFAAQVAASELMMHGHGDTSRAVWERALALLATRPDSEHSTNDYREIFAYDLLSARRFDAAAVILDTLLMAQPESPDYLGMRGIAYAARHDSAGSNRIEAHLKRLGNTAPPADVSFWEAAIAAAKGDRDSAVSLLRESLARGKSAIDIEGSAVLAPLAGYRPFLALLIPRQ